MGHGQVGAGLEPGEISLRKLVRMAVVCVLLALAPFAVWTARNWRVFHVFQPLAPRLANDPGEEVNPGWQRWVKTWCLDFVSTYEDLLARARRLRSNCAKLPSRAFDSPAQYDETAALAADYNVRHGATDIGRISMRALSGWPRSASPRIRCATMCGCRWAAWPTCGCARAWKT